MRLFHLFGAAGHIGLVLGVGAHAGDAEQVEQFVEEAVLVGFDVGVEVLHGSLDGRRR